MKKTQDPIIVTPPKPLPIPSPTYSLEEGEQGTSEAEVVTEPKARFVGSTHEEIPEWPGPYHIVENGLYECAGYEFSTNLLVEVPPKGLTEITITENGTYKPSDYDGYSKVIVDVFSPTLETLNATENKTYTAPEGKAYDEVVVNVPSQAPTLVTKTITANGVYNASSDNADGYSSVNVSVSSSSLPTLYTVSLNYGNSSTPVIVNTSSQNGMFIKGIVWKNGSSGDPTQVSINVMSTTTILLWVYDQTPIAGGSATIYAKATADKFNDSAETNRSITIPSATETTGYCSVAGLGNEGVTSQTYTYDTNFPRSFQEVQDTYGNTFIKIPTIYRKILASSDGQITSYALATSALDSDYKPFPCFIDRTNSNAILPYILIGKWCMSSTTAANSVEASGIGMTSGFARTLAQARGTGYQLYDWQMWELFRDLGLVISRYININNSFTIPEVMGICQMNTTLFIDGIIGGSSDDAQQWYCAYDPADYYSPTAYSESEASILSHNYTKLSYKSPSVTGFITKLGYDPDNPFFNQPSEASGGGGGTYYCDYYYYSSVGSSDIYNSFGASSNYNGWFGCQANGQWVSNVLNRLCYRPILNATGYTE